MIRDIAAPLLVPFLCLTACGGSAPPPAEPRAAKKNTAPAPYAERAKASRLARLEAEPVAAPAPESVVQVSFEPLVTGVRPGRSFLLAAHFRIASGYRISWKNPGDVGKETVVTFRAPDGFEVGPVVFPAPERYTVPGGFVGFGYENETAVFVEVKAPPNLARSRVNRFDLSASWVACKKECATEHTDAFVELATTYGSAAAKEVESGLAPFQARLPKPLSAVKDAEQKWEEGRHAFVVSIPGAELRDFIPAEKAEPAPKKVSMSGNVLRVAFQEAPGPTAKPVRGVVVASLDGKDVFFELDTGSEGEVKPSPAPKANAHAKPKRASARRHGR